MARWWYTSITLALGAGILAGSFLRWGRVAGDRRRPNSLVGFLGTIVGTVFLSLGLTGVVLGLWR